MEKNLLIKIIYKLNSDVDTVDNSSLTTATPIIFNRLTGGNNYGPYQYKENGIDYFSITRTGLAAEANFNVQIYDYLMTPSNQQLTDYPEDSALKNQTIEERANLNSSLTLELLDSSGAVLARSLNTDTKITKEVNEQQIKLFNFISKESPGAQQYYLKITGTHKLGYYGISLIEPDVESSDSQVAGVYSSYKLTQINNSDLSLTTTSEDLDDEQRIYSRSHNDNVLLLMSDSGGDNMKINNFSFEGEPKFNLTTEYDNNENILEMLILTNNKFVIVTNGDGVNINYDIYNGNESDWGLERTIVSSERAPIPGNFMIRELLVPNEDGSEDESNDTFIVTAFLANSSSYLTLQASMDTDTGFPEYSDILGITTPDSSENVIQINTLVNILVFDENNIFVVGNVTTNHTSMILKFTLDTSSGQFSFVETKLISQEDDNNYYKTIYAEKHDYEGESSIIVFYEQGEDEFSNFSISSFSLDFSEQKNIGFFLGSTRVPIVDTKIMNFIVKRDVILVLWEDEDNNNRYFQSYVIQLTSEDYPINNVKSETYTASNLLSSVDTHKVVLNANTENVYVILSKNKIASVSSTF